MCGERKQCYYHPNICDGLYDCEDKDDERNCDHRSIKFNCTDGYGEYDKKTKCDGYEDCQDGSDEIDCQVID